MRRRQYVGRPDRDRGALTVRPTNQVAEIAFLLTRYEALILQPEIVEELRQVFVAGIAGKRDDGA